MCNCLNSLDDCCPEVSHTSMVFSLSIHSYPSWKEAQCKTVWPEKERMNANIKIHMNFMIERWKSWLVFKSNWCIFQFLICCSRVLMRAVSVAVTVQMASMQIIMATVWPRSIVHVNSVGRFMHLGKAWRQTVKHGE